MNMGTRLVAAAPIVILLPALGVNIETVPAGDSGNADDTHGLNYSPSPVRPMKDASSYEAAPWGTAPSGQVGQRTRQTETG